MQETITQAGLLILAACTGVLGVKAGRALGRIQAHRQNMRQLEADLHTARGSWTQSWTQDGDPYP